MYIDTNDVTALMGDSKWLFAFSRGAALTR
jgi:hypothetical protein